MLDKWRIFLPKMVASAVVLLLSFVGLRMALSLRAERTKEGQSSQSRLWGRFAALTEISLKQYHQLRKTAWDQRQARVHSRDPLWRKKYRSGQPTPYPKITAAQAKEHWLEAAALFYSLPLPKVEDGEYRYYWSWYHTECEVVDGGDTLRLTVMEETAAKAEEALRKIMDLYLHLPAHFPPAHVPGDPLPQDWPMPIWSGKVDVVSR